MNNSGVLRRYMEHKLLSSREVARIGMDEKAAKAAGIEYFVWTEAFKDNDRSLAEGEKIGKIKMILDKKERISGVQILGPQSVELKQEL